jgi:endo-1,4-beta-D-glucanase Y
MRYGACSRPSLNSVREMMNKTAQAPARGSSTLVPRLRQRMLRPLRLAAYFIAMASATAGAQAASCDNWPAWSSFRLHFMNEGGRIVNPASPNSYSTSEGQSYGLFFALVANDRDSFERILRWTEDNLAGGDLTARLPAWKWGMRDDNNWGVIDENSAADADLWVSYALAEAGRLWKEQKFSALSRLLAERIVREETAQIAGFGRTLLPGQRGFEPEPGVYRLNPSYLPVQLMRRMAALYPQSEWTQLVTTSIDIIVRSSPRGFAPDWVLYKENSGFQPDTGSNAAGSHNAIRVYLWAGMLADSDPVHPVLLKTLASAAEYIVRNGTPPLETNSRAGTADGAGPAGFSAAMLPFLAASHLPDAVNQQRLRLAVKPPLERADNYYEQALTLFGAGWLDGYYRFANTGALLPRWICGAN